MPPNSWQWLNETAIRGEIFGHKITIAVTATETATAVTAETQCQTLIISLFPPQY